MRVPRLPTCTAIARFTACAQARGSFVATSPVLFRSSSGIPFWAAVPYCCLGSINKVHVARLAGREGFSFFFFPPRRAECGEKLARIIKPAPAQRRESRSRRQKREPFRRRQTFLKARSPRACKKRIVPAHTRLLPTALAYIHRDDDDTLKKRLSP